MIRLGFEKRERIIELKLLREGLKQDEELRCKTFEVILREIGGGGRVVF